MHMSERALQLEKPEHIPKPKRNSFWIVGYLGLPGARSQIIGVDNQELTAHVDIKPTGSLAFPRGVITASITPVTQSPGRSGALNPQQSQGGNRNSILILQRPELLLELEEYAVLCHKLQPE